MKKEEPKKKVDSNTKPTELNIKEVKGEPSTTEIKGDRATYINVDITPLKSNKLSLRETYAALFAREKERITGKPHKGDPTMEAAGSRPELVKYYENWSKCEA